MKPHYLRQDEKDLWDRYMTASLMGGSAPMEAARYADQSVEAFYSRFTSTVLPSPEGGPGTERVWARNERDHR